MLKKVMVILNIEKLFLMFFSPVKKSTIQLSSLNLFIEHLIFLQKCIFKIKLTYFFSCLQIPESSTWKIYV